MLSLKNISIIDKKTNQPLINNVSLEVKSGDFVVISGQKAKERDLLVSVLGALESVESGEVYVDGIEQTKYTNSQMISLRREKFGYMLEDCVLDEYLSTAENIVMPLVFAGAETKIKNEKLERALNIVGLTNFKDVLVKDLTEWQKNKVLIARAIVSMPSVVVFSEPCRVQDRLKMEEVVGLLTALNKDGVTVIVNSNREEYVGVAKRRIVITNGSILELKKERAPRQIEPKKTKRTAKPKKDKPKKQENTAKEENVTKVEIQPEVEPVKIVAEKESPVKKRTKKKESGVNSEQLKFELAQQEEVEQAPKKRGRKKQGVDNNADAN